MVDVEVRISDARERNVGHDGIGRHYRESAENRMRKWSG